MRNCNQSGLLQAILDALVNQGDTLNDNVVVGESACFLLADGTNAVLQPVVKDVDGVLTGIGYIDEHGTPVTQAVTPADSCDCPCAPCVPVVAKICTMMSGFDLGLQESGFSVGGLTYFRVTVNGVANAIIAHDYSTTTDSIGKASWYAPVIAELNAVAGWTVSLFDDAAVEDSNDKATWSLEYVGSVVSEVTIEKADNPAMTGGDSMAYYADGTGDPIRHKYSWEGAGTPPFTDC